MLQNCLWSGAFGMTNLVFSGNRSMLLWKARVWAGGGPSTKNCDELPVVCSYPDLISDAATQAPRSCDWVTSLLFFPVRSTAKGYARVYVKTCPLVGVITSSETDQLSERLEEVFSSSESVIYLVGCLGMLLFPLSSCMFVLVVQSG